MAMPMSASRQRGRVVDAVADHGDCLALSHDALYLGGFLRRQNLRHHALYARFGRDCARDALIVPRQHHDFDAMTPQFRDGGWRLRLQRIRDGNDAG